MNQEQLPTEEVIDALAHSPNNALRTSISKSIEQSNPEESLVIWQCSFCGCDCAGISSSGMCSTCEQLTPEQRGEEE